MSRAQFEGLVDDLSALLLTVNFGSAESLALARIRVESILSFLTSCKREELGLPAKKLLSLLPNPASQRALDAAARKVVVSQLERLTQTWYDAAKSWRESGAGADQLLHLSDAADPALLAEFVANARLTSEELEALIDEIRSGSAEATAALRRMIHTLKGESGMLGLDQLAQLLHATETYLEVPATSWDRADLLLSVRDWMLDALAQYEKGRLPEKSTQSLIDQLTSSENAEAAATPATSVAATPATSVAATPATSVAATPAPSVAATPATSVAGPATLSEPVPSAAGAPASPPSLLAGQSPEGSSLPTFWDEEELELVAEFLHESQETTAVIDQTLLDIEREGPDAENINKLFRAFHTVKGVASFLRMDQIVELAHTTETMLDLVRSGKLVAATGVIDLVFDATTCLRALFQAVAATAATSVPLAVVPGTRQLVQRIQAANRGESPQGSILPAEPGVRLGEILVENCAISETQLNEALALQKKSGRKLGEELVLRGSVPAKVVAQALRGQSDAAKTVGKSKERVKVDLERVDSLVGTIGELVVVESMVSHAPEIEALPVHLRNYLGQFAKLTRELQELGMCMRMVPLRAEFQKMARMVRDLTHRSNKQVRVELRGDQTEMDRSMVEQIADPLVHLIRNAVDHGVELPADRLACGKPETATIVLSATHEGTSIVIEISDDGRGIDRERVLAKALAQGLIGEGAVLSDSQVYELLFLPGFSTAAQVTEISGRGVGMDVVKRNIDAIRGRIVTQSVKGRGTSFRLVLPLTLAIIDGMVIRSGSERFIVPTLNIIESLQPTEEMLFTIADAQEHLMVRGQCVRLMRLGNLLGVDAPEADPTKALAIIVESMHSKVALLVDEVVMKHQVVIKTLDEELAVSHLFAGAAILSNGRVGLILNVESLVRTALSNRGERHAALN